MLRRFFGAVLTVLATAFSASAQDVQSVPADPYVIDVYAHYVTWHEVPGEWHTASVMPVLRDNAVGGYEAENPAMIAANNAIMTANGIRPMTSWWGPTLNGGDNFLDVYLPIPGPQTAILYEATGRLKSNAQLYGPSGNKDKDVRYDFSVPFNADTFVADMKYLHRRYFTGPYANRFARIDGRPVVFIWISHAFDGPFDRAMERVRQEVPVYLIGSDFGVPFGVRPGGETVIPAMDAISAYGVYNPRHYGAEMSDEFVTGYVQALQAADTWMAVHAPHMKIMAPLGFNYDETLIPGRSGLLFRGSPEVSRRWTQEVRKAIANPCNARLLHSAFLVSFDECYEGTCITPSKEYGSVYLDIIRETFTPPVITDPDWRLDCKSPQDGPRR